MHIIEHAALVEGLSPDLPFMSDLGGFGWRSSRVPDQRDLLVEVKGCPRDPYIQEEKVVLPLLGSGVTMRRASGMLSW